MIMFQLLKVKEHGVSKLVAVGLHDYQADSANSEALN